MFISRNVQKRRSRSFGKENIKVNNENRGVGIGSGWVVILRTVKCLSFEKSTSYCV